VLIDEIETHLHLELQEIILPFLCEMFPRIQFIVATHSPAVISSVEDAVVYDLRKREPVSSADLQGIRYGTLMTSHHVDPQPFSKTCGLV
jgi:predicted ATP-dependent endonuclease of OLD family